MLIPPVLVAEILVPNPRQLTQSGWATHPPELPSVVGHASQGVGGLLAADVVAYTDGGGQARAVTDPGLWTRGRSPSLLPGTPAGRESCRGERQPGALLLDPTGRPVVVVSLDIADEVVQTVRASVTPTSCVISLGRSKPE